MEMLRLGATDNSDIHRRVTDILKDALGSYVECLCYDARSMERISEEEYYRHQNNSSYRCVRGPRPYFDGESEIFFTDLKVSESFLGLHSAPMDEAQMHRSS